MTAAFVGRLRPMGLSSIANSSADKYGGRESQIPCPSQPPAIAGPTPAIGFGRASTTLPSSLASVRSQANVTRLTPGVAYSVGHPPASPPRTFPVGTTSSTYRSKRHTLASRTPPCCRTSRSWPKDVKVQLVGRPTHLLVAILAELDAHPADNRRQQTRAFCLSFNILLTISPSHYCGLS